ncbi:FG-GAP-like repeat-containing protein [Kitasatospora sp. NPDC028055]|uniref:FG-GAP-like repeat-containing protein n=1 Tax=Kitasatospora sp. NPDC028055 TaxID=3155653 RepID=UPI0033CBE5B6
MATALCCGLVTAPLAAAAPALADTTGCAAYPTPLAATSRPSPATSPWTGSWGTALSNAGPAAQSGVSGQQTLRMVVHSSIAGNSARIHLANTFSSAPVTIGHATIAVQGSGATPAATPVTLTFGGGQQTVIPAGGDVYSDQAAFPVTADENLLVSIYLPDPVSSAPYHPDALTTSYTSAPGDSTDHAAGAGSTGFTTSYYHWAYLSGLDVTAGGGGTVVAIGDSQTDEGHTTADTNRRWVDDYGRALQAQPNPMGVVNEGLSGNRLLTDAPGQKPGYGASALTRFDRDVLAQPNARSVILYEGINDISLDGATDAALEAGIQQLSARAHAKGLSFSVATIPPFEGNSMYSAAKDNVRQCVNAYIRSTSDIDHYLDFDQATRDPLAPGRLFAGYYNRGDDQLHLNDNGNQVLANTIAAPPAASSVPLNFSQQVAGDFRGTGHTDLIARDTSGNLYRWPGNGDGTFGSRILLTGGWNFTQTTAADLTGDGIADLVAKDSAGNLYLWTGNAGGTFSTKKLLTSGWNYTQTTAADLTGTGRADLIAADSNGNLYRWPGNGDGTFGSRILLTGGWNFTQTTAADFRGTGHADLIARDDSTGTLYRWPGNGDGTFGARTAVTAGWAPFSQTTAGRFRGTGAADLIARNDSTGDLDEWDNVGNASFTRPLRLTGGW